MKLEQKIRDRKIAYLFRRKPEIAFELALLYFIAAKRKISRKKIADACVRSIHWLKKAGIAIPAYLEQMSCFSQVGEIEKILVLNRSRC